MYGKVIGTGSGDMWDWQLNQLMCSERIVPKEFKGYFNVSNLPLHVHREGPLLRDHLRSMLKIASTIYYLPAELQYLQPLFNDRLFFMFAIVWHDIGKGVIEPRTIEEGGKKLSLYPDHERVSFELLSSYPEITDSLPNGQVLLDVVRWHGEVYALGAEPVSQDAFTAFLKKTGIEGRVKEVLPYLLAFCLVDVYGTDREDPWEYRVLNVSRAYKEYLQTH